ncbi:MAG: hypothetical protein WBD27_17430 [Pyrinomonadaceae bacterium]
MLVIRRQQIQEFIARDEAELTDVVRDAIREANGDRVKDYANDDLNAMLRIGIERAKSHELACAEDIAYFVAIMFEVAPRFDEQTDIRKVLENTVFPSDIKLEQLFTCVDDAAWIEAGRLYEDSFWFPAETVNG